MVSYYHKLCSPTDPTTSFMVKKLLTGVTKLRPSADARRPITLPILRKLVAATQAVAVSNYHQTLMSAMFTLAFHAFLRISEIAGGTNTHHAILFDNIHLFPSAIKITFTSFKHHKGAPVSVIVKKAAAPCPLTKLAAYLKIRPKIKGPLFVFRDGSAVTQSFFRAHLKACLHLAGEPAAKLKSHSFRIGAATEAARRGCSDDEIQRMGRWGSHAAFRRYVRIPSLSTPW